MGRGHFRAFKSAVSLKQRLDVVRGRGVGRFPRLQKRGLIEAKAFAPDPVYSPHFRAFKSAVSLKRNDGAKGGQGE